eukprot:13745211-Ditylum_brightwellii.AAC.1
MSGIVSGTSHCVSASKDSVTWCTLACEIAACFKHSFTTKTEKWSDPQEQGKLRSAATARDTQPALRQW